MRWRCGGTLPADFELGGDDDDDDDGDDDDDDDPTVIEIDEDDELDIILSDTCPTAALGRGQEAYQVGGLDEKA